MRHKSRGQAPTEFALVLPILALVLLIALDFGRVFFGWINLQNTARIGANFAAQHPRAWTTTPNPLRDAYEQEIRADAAQMNCELPEDDDLPDPTFSSYTFGGHVTVTMTCDFTLFTPLICNALGNPMTISATSVFPIRGGCLGCPSPVIVSPEPGITPTPSPTASPTASPSPSPSPSPTLDPLATPDPSATATATAAATLTASPSPSPSPAPCVVPTLNQGNLDVNQARQAWQRAGFTGAFEVLRPPNGPYTVTSQSLAPGLTVPCTISIQVGGS